MFSTFSAFICCSLLYQWIQPIVSLICVLVYCLVVDRRCVCLGTTLILYENALAVCYKELVDIVEWSFLVYRFKIVVGEWVRS